MSRQLTAEQKTIRDQVCADCGHRLARWFDPKTKERYVACSNNPQHRMVARPAQVSTENRIITEERMVQQHGLATMEQLHKYQGLTTLTETQATDIMRKLFPGAEDASPMEVFKAVSITVQYGLNPLMNHIFLVPFTSNRGKSNEKTTYATVLGIRATRLIASRKHRYSYIDYTPRKMTSDEEIKVFGVVDPTMVSAITTLKDVTTGATASGYGRWPLYKVWNGQKEDNQPKGTDKGNSQMNMAMIRSERQAFDRLYPADMPGAEIRTIDESQTIECQYEEVTESPAGERTIDSATGEIVETDAVRTSTKPLAEPDPSFTALESASAPEEQPNVTPITEITRRKLIVLDAKIQFAAWKASGVVLGGRPIGTVSEEEAQKILAAVETVSVAH